ncbi:MAG TPA: helix-turn-helix domain-containing protein [Candidatus Paceibacterota bacterium]|nr:helix-turn-helix domain-containing protein [Candidatus Paceibacterota bacterium]
MDYKKLLSALEALGLHEKAASIYLALLGKQRMSIAELSRETAIKRATCYEYLDLLLQKDLVVRVPVKKRTLYSAASPQRILSEYKKQSRGIESVLQELSAMHNKAIHKPKVTFYEGKREIRRIYEGMFQTVGDSASIFPPASFFENFTEADYEEFDKDVTSHAFKSRDLFVADKYYKKIKEIRAKNGAEAKFDKKLPSWFTSNVDTLIYADKVALISLRDLSAIVIENKDIADLFRNMHDFMWKFS